MKICPVCGTTFPDDARFCPKDGSPLTDLRDQNLGMVLMGQFRLEEKIGEGAVSEVYRALQLGMERVVAVKILKKSVSGNPDVVRRFRREARAIARLSHPNIVSVFVVGETEDDQRPYIVMEYLEGETLEVLMAAQAPFVPERTVFLARQIASALDHAHGNGIIHRDLKPSNIVVLDHSTPSERIKVLDFGIAKIVHGHIDESQITRTGEVFGTPYYLSPEQARGEHLDGRSDLYSLGVIMFRMATGHLPFEEESGLELLVKHMRQPAPDPRQSNPDVPEGLANIINRLLLKDPEDRYPSASALIDALDAFSGGKEVPPVDSTGISSSSGQVPALRQLTEPVTPLPVPVKKSGKGLLAGIALLAVVLVTAVWWLTFGDSDDTLPDISGETRPATATQSSTKTADATEAAHDATASPELFACEYEFDGDDTIEDECNSIPVTMKITRSDRNPYSRTIRMCSRQSLWSGVRYHSFPPYATPGVKEVKSPDDQSRSGCLTLELNMPRKSDKAGLIIDLPQKSIRLEMIFRMGKKNRHPRRARRGSKHRTRPRSTEKPILPSVIEPDAAPPKLPELPDSPRSSGAGSHGSPMPAPMKKKSVSPPKLPAFNDLYD